MSARHSLRCFSRGLALSLSKPYLAVSLWLIQLLLASVLILPIFFNEIVLEGWLIFKGFNPSAIASLPEK